MPSVSAARNTPFRCRTSSAISATKFRAPPLNRWIWRPLRHRRPPHGASARPGKDNPAAAAGAPVAVRAGRTDPAAGARAEAHHAAVHPPAPHIRTHPGPKPPPRILETRQERAIRRRRIPTGADVAADAVAAAAPPAARRIPARQAPRSFGPYSNSATPSMAAKSAVA